MPFYLKFAHDKEFNAVILISCCLLYLLVVSSNKIFLSLIIRQPTFQRYPRPEKEYQSFSLIYDDRSLDLVIILFGGDVLFL